jgi:ribokinase
MSNVLVIGSTNTDMTVQTKRFPKEGETVLGNKYSCTLGGKGANQAVAAARLGASVTFVSRIGADSFGQQAINQYKNESIDTSLLQIDQNTQTGVALITLNEKGENTIVVAPGANQNLSANSLSDIDKYILLADVVLIQLEIPMETVEYVVEKAKKYGKKVILNPAPATKLSDKLLDGLYLITPNQSEADLLIGTEITDEEPLRRAADLLRMKGVKNVIFTLGEKGVYLSTPSVSKYYDTPRVKVVDTTAAGDILNGALAVALSQNMDWDRAITFAVNAASISVTKSGALSSAPTMAELEEFEQKLAKRQETQQLDTTY